MMNLPKIAEPFAMTIVLTILVLIFSLLGFMALIGVVYPFKALGFSSRKEALKGWAGSTIIVIVLSIFLALNSEEAVTDAGREAEKSLAATQTTTTELGSAETENVAKTDEAPAEPIIPFPEEQISFTRVVLHFINEHKKAETDFQRGSLRPARKQAICQNLTGRQLKDWYGYATDISTNGDGLGVVAIEIADNVQFSTTNNSFSDIGNNTLIEPNSKLYQKLGGIPERSLVKFTGRLFQSDVDCIEEQSVTLSGSLRDPDFLIRLQDIELIEGAAPRKRESFLKSLLD